MRNIISLIAVIILQIACKKNEQTFMAEPETISGNWSANYFGQPLKISVEKDNSFSMNLPVIVKKSINSAPETLNLYITGVCVMKEGGCELKINTIDGADAETAGSVVTHSLEKMEIEILQQEDNKPLNRKLLTAHHGKLRLSGTVDQ